MTKHLSALLTLSLCLLTLSAQRTPSQPRQEVGGVMEVVFIDSLVVPRADLLSHLPLTPEAGRFCYARSVTGRAVAVPDSALAFVTGLGDRAYFAAADSLSHPRLCVAYREGGAWGKPEPLPGLDALPFTAIAAPFLDAEGQTLYFAAATDTLCADFDLYVTRYDRDTRAFVAPERLPQPFLSASRDEVFAIDEQTAVGYFVTNRRQPADTVCIYYFVPEASFVLYEEGSLSDAALLSRAALRRLADTQPPGFDAAALMQQRAAVLQRTPEAARPTFVINDATVYHALSDFRSPQARRIAAQWLAEQQACREAECQLAALRQQYASAPDAPTATAIREAEQRLRAMRQTLRALAKNMRAAELKSL